MSVTLTAVSQGSYAVSNKKVRTYDIAFSGNYATGGETINASSVGLKKIISISAPGVAMATAGTTACPVSFTISSSGTSVVVRSFEAASSAAPLLEKDNAEAYITGQKIRVEFVGF